MALLLALASVPGAVRGQEVVQYHYPPTTFDDAVSDENASPQPSSKDFSGLAGALIGGGARPPVRYRIAWQPLREVEGQPAEFGLVTQDAAVVAPIWKGNSDTVLLSLGLRHDVVGGNVILPDSKRPLPDELWDARIGLIYLHKCDNGWTSGAILNVGSAGDRPFAATRDMNVGAIGFVRVPHLESNAWIFALIYQPMSELPYPIPAVTYSWQPSERLSMNLGVPLTLTYRPNDDWTFDFSYMVLRTIHAKASYRFAERWRIYAAYDWSNVSWQLNNRTDARERLFLYDQKVTAGVIRELGDHLLLDLSVGYLFDRYLFTGRQYADSRHDRVNVADGPMLGFQAGLRW
ncbi:MAG: hypothetical protein K2X38_22830 [Gemmataceae bacterium]|nr:hypothetical protein [Gemmataceae bacterium]